VRLDLFYEQNPIWSCCVHGPTSTRRDTESRRTSLVIEVADSSLEYDRDVKARVYAAAEIPEYWLADLEANVVWRYTSPERGMYRDVEPLRRGHSIAPRLLPSCEIAVDALLPE
jgi:Uma2 family endonuclease